MAIHWLTAFLDYPGEDFAAGTNFWRAITASALSPPRGADGEFATLLPPDGDAFVRVQRIGEGVANCHLDLHMDDIDAEARRAETGGASVQRRGQGIVTMRSPAGLDFCVVAHHGEHERPRPVRWPDGHQSLLDQVCVDVAARVFDDECAFWTEFSGWPLQRGARAEFAYLTRPSTIALRLLFQRVEDPAKDRASAHLDFASDDVTSEVQRHESLGARVRWTMENWTTLEDPTGLAYCVTRRRPDTGTLDESSTS
ncbi:MAG: VOC family protein [Acidimicrobiales bacterium]